MSDYDVLGLGAVSVDDLLLIDRYPPADSKVRVIRRERQAGGQTGTALVAAARLGARCAYGGMLGDDDLSRFVIGRFQEAGIETSTIERDPTGRPAHCTVLVDIEAHSRTVFASVDGRLGVADHGLPDRLIARTRLLLVDHHGVVGTCKAVRRARELGVAVVADIERDPSIYDSSLEAAFNELVETVDHLVVPAEFAVTFADRPDARGSCAALWNERRRAVVVTCGESGGFFFAGPAEHPAGPLPYRAYEVDVVDTTGCGDVFHGAYAAAIAEGKPLDEACRFASAAAALKARHAGGQDGIPSRAALDGFLVQNL